MRSFTNYLWKGEISAYLTKFGIFHHIVVTIFIMFYTIQNTIRRHTKTKKPCHFRPHFKSLKRLQSFPNSGVDDFSSERRDSKLHGNGSLSASCSATTKRSAYFQRTTPYFLTLRKRNGATAY